MEYITKNAEETAELGEEFGTSLESGPVVIALEGNLGSGKTTFVQGMAKGLEIKGRIISPTFIIMRSYAGARNLYHIDMYRLDGDLENEVKSLGLTDIWKDPKNVVVIEWAEKIGDLLPEGTKWVRFDNLGEGRRKINFDD